MSNPAFSITYATTNLDSRTPHTLRLLPGRQQFGAGVAEFNFTVAPNGTITYDPTFRFVTGAGEVAAFVIPTDPPWAISATIWAWLGTVTALALALALDWRAIAAVIGWPLLVAHLWSGEVPAPPWMAALVLVLAVSLTL